MAFPEPKEQNLYIKLGDNGGPVTHPMVEENLRHVIADFDPKNPPDNIVKFVKVPVPEPVGEWKYDYLDYAYSPELSEKYGQTTWCEVHNFKRITAEERDEIIRKFKELNPELDDWVYDPTTMTLKTPKPMPDDGKTYYWDVHHKEWMESRPELHLDDMMEVAKELGHDITRLGGNHDLTHDELRHLVDTVTQGQQKRPPELKPKITPKPAKKDTKKKT